ncbi:acyltransferase [Streptomyces sp. NPDC052236]|uniref:acyltransferase n=1 Tax=Streptomyces sp. NPDC052236 TaxID=3365686 RepID=UPI0037D6BBCD
MGEAEFPGVRFKVGRRRIGDGVRIGAGCDLRWARLTLAADARVGESTRVLAADRFVLGRASVLDGGSEVTCRSMTVGDSTYLGHRLRVGLGARMEARSTLTVGSCCQIAPDVWVNPTEPVTIGDDVGISARVALWTHGHHSGHAAADGFAGIFAGITIGGGVWLAYDVGVLPGVTVGAHTQVAARALVNRSLPARVLAAGIPAVVKRQLQPRPLNGPALAEAVQALTGAWLDRLAHKGLAVEPTGEGQWWVADPETEEAWNVVRQPAGDSAGTLRLAVIRPGAEAEPTLFCFDRVSISGEPDRLGHDLRDFCRRQSWLFPHYQNSTALVPARFAQLLNAAP